MTFYLLRHGATKGNREKRYVGATDEPLLPESRAALSSLCLPAVSRVYISPMLRCMETAALLYPNVPVEAVSGFRECDFGEFEYRNFKELKDRPEYQAWLDSRGRVAFPGGESREAFSFRVVRAFDRVAGKAEKQNGDAAIIAHGGTIMAIFEARSLPARDFYEYQVANGRGYAARWQDGALEILSSL